MGALRLPSLIGLASHQVRQFCCPPLSLRDVRIRTANAFRIRQSVRSLAVVGTMRSVSLNGDAPFFCALKAGCNVSWEGDVAPTWLSTLCRTSIAKVNAGRPTRGGSDNPLLPSSVSR